MTREGLAPELVPLAEKCDAMLARLTRAQYATDPVEQVAEVWGALAEALEDQRGEPVPAGLSKLIGLLDHLLARLIERDRETQPKH